MAPFLLQSCGAQFARQWNSMPRTLPSLDETGLAAKGTTLKQMEKLLYGLGWLTGSLRLLERDWENGGKGRVPVFLKGSMGVSRESVIYALFPLYSAHVSSLLRTDRLHSKGFQEELLSITYDHFIDVADSCKLKFAEQMEADYLEADRDIKNAQVHAELFSLVFGDSDTDDDLSNDTCVAGDVDCQASEGHVWEEVKEVNGLWHCRHFLSHKQQQYLLNSIDAEGWFSDSLHNQAMRFVDLPGWALELSAQIQNSINDPQGASGLGKLRFNEYSKNEGLPILPDCTSPAPAQMLRRVPLFDQMIVNSYQPGEGISAHVDLLRFEDGIAIVSLLSACVMTFRIVEGSSVDGECADTKVPILNSVWQGDDLNNTYFMRDITTGGPISSLQHLVGSENEKACSSLHGQRSEPGPLSSKQLDSSEVIAQTKECTSRSYRCWRSSTSGVAKKVDVLLSPGDLLVIHGPARYNWSHEITHGKDHQVWQGEPLPKKRRVSVTLRRLCLQSDGD